MIKIEKVFKSALKIYFIVHVMPVFIFRLKQLKKQPKATILRTLKNLFFSTIFLTFQVSLIRSGFCAANNSRGTTDRLTGIIGIIAGNCAIMFESIGRRRELALYMAPKGIEGTWGYLERRGVVKSIPYSEEIILMFSMGILAIGSVEKKDFIKPSYNNVLKSIWE